MKMNEQTRKCRAALKRSGDSLNMLCLFFFFVLFVFHVALLFFQGFQSIFLETVFIVVP